ncbi:hypothetical protein ACWGKR_29455 [Bacillus thuringiensis]
MDNKQGDKSDDLSMFLGAGCFIVILLLIGFGIFGIIGALIEGGRQ